MLINSQKSLDVDERRLLPTSYVFELLTISRWEQALEQAEKQEKFSEKQVFRDIMMQLANPGDINAEWTDYYNRGHFKNAAKKELDK